MADVRELTLTDKKKLEAEMEELLEAKKRVAEEIQTARGFGDLSENAEYDAAKKEEARVYGRIGELEQLLRTAKFIDDSAAGSDEVALGTVVRVLDMEYNEELEYNIVGSTEANSLSGKISNESPLGKSLIGHKVGDVVDVETPTSDIIKFTVLSIERNI